MSALPWSMSTRPERMTPLSGSQQQVVSEGHHYTWHQTLNAQRREPSTARKASKNTRPVSSGLSDIPETPYPAMHFNLIQFLPSPEGLLYCLSTNRYSYFRWYTLRNSPVHCQTSSRLLIPVTIHQNYMIWVYRDRNCFNFPVFVSRYTPKAHSRCIVTPMGKAVETTVRSESENIGNSCHYLYYVAKGNF